MTLTGFTSLSPVVQKLVSEDYSPAALSGHSARVRTAVADMPVVAANRLIDTKTAGTMLLHPKAVYLNAVVKMVASAESGAIAVAIFDKNGNILAESITINVLNGTTVVNVPMLSIVGDNGDNPPAILGFVVKTASTSLTNVQIALMYTSES